MRGRGQTHLLRKAIDLSIEKIVAINEEVEKRGVQLMVGFNRRYDPNFLKVHDTVKAEESASRRFCESPAAILRRRRKRTSGHRAESSWT